MENNHFLPDVNTSNNNEMCLFNKIFCNIHIRHKGDLKKKVFNWEMICIPVKHLSNGKLKCPKRVVYRQLL